MTHRDEAARAAAAPSATPTWLRPLGPDPDLADVRARAVVVGRMAGRVAVLASDLQLLAMLLVDLSAQAGTIGVVGDAPSGANSQGQSSSSAATPDGAGASLTNDAEQPDPFARAEAAIGALRDALRPISDVQDDHA